MAKCNCKQPNNCQRPKHLKTKPEDCSSEQISKCHGDTKKHPCVKKD